MAQFQIPQKKNAKGKIVSQGPVPVDTHERPLTPRERAYQSEVSRQANQFRSNQFPARYRPLVDNAALIPIPPEWTHEGLHPAVYLSRFQDGPSRVLAESCCEAMLAWWNRHGERARDENADLPEPRISEDPEVPTDPSESNVEVVSTGDAGDESSSVDEDPSPPDPEPDEESTRDEEDDDALDELTKSEQVDPADLLREEEGAEAGDVGDDEYGDELPVADDDAPPPDYDLLDREDEDGEETEELDEAEDDLEAEADAEEDEPTEPEAEDQEDAEEEPPLFDEFPCPAAGCEFASSSKGGLTLHINAKHKENAEELHELRER